MEEPESKGRRVAGSRALGRRAGGLAVGLLLAAAVPAAAQDSRLDPRWQAWLGCWAPVGSDAGVSDTAGTHFVCVAPATGTSGVEIVTLVNGAVVHRDTVVASGERSPVSQDGCTGWQRVEWSAAGVRAYLRSEITCPGNLTRTTTGVMAISENGGWLDVQGLAMRGQTGVHAVRYGAVRTPASVPSELAAALEGHDLAVGMARAAAAGPLRFSDVIDASRHLDAAVVEAWLAEQGQEFALTGRKLAALKDSGVPDRVIDVMVALSYPGRFAVNSASSQGAFGPVTETQRAPRGYADSVYTPAYPYGYGGMYGYYSPWGWDSYWPYGWYSPFGWGYYSPYGYAPYGYGYSPYAPGWWYGGGVVIYGGGQSLPHGRVVKGRGYVNPTSGTGRTAHPSSSSPSPRSSSGTRTASPPPSSSSSGSSGSSSGRTAHPRP